MAVGDSRRVVQVNNLDLRSINEALRQLNESITILEGRKGQIQLKDGLGVTSSTQTAAQFAAQFLADANFGVYFGGVNGTDVWLAAGASLAPSAEWIATKTRAVLFKFDNLTGGQIYFNTGLTIGASFIPTLQSTNLSAPVWGFWESNVEEAGEDSYTWNNEVHTDASYFLRQSSNQEIKILTDGYYEIIARAGSSPVDVGAGIISSQTALWINTVSVASAITRDIATEDSNIVYSQTLQYIDFLPADDIVQVNLSQGLTRTPAGTDGTTTLSIRLLRT